MSSISRCSASRRGSVATISCANTASALAIAPTTIFSAMPPISAMRPLDRVELLVEGLEGMFDQGFPT